MATASYNGNVEVIKCRIRPEAHHFRGAASRKIFQMLVEQYGDNDKIPMAKLRELKQYDDVTYGGVGWRGVAVLVGLSAVIISMFAMLGMARKYDDAEKTFFNKTEQVSRQLQK